MTVKQLIGTDADQVSLNRDLGSLAFQSADSAHFTGGKLASSTTASLVLLDNIKQNTSRSGSLPSFSFDYTKNKYIDSRFTFSRNSVGTYVGADGYLKTAPVNTPRFDYDPITNVIKGLLIESEKTNIILNSSNLTNTTSWYYGATASVTVSSQSVTSPAGDATSYQIAEAATTSQHFIEAKHAVTSGVTYTFSVWLKAGTQTIVQLAGDSNGFGTNIWANFNLSTGVVVNSGAGTTSWIYPYPNGWYRCVISAVATATYATQNFFVCTTNNNSALGRGPSYLGVVTNTYYMYGPQVEVGAFPTTYIPTSGTAVTRPRDYLYVDTAALNTFYKYKENSFFVEAQTYPYPLTVTIFSAHVSGAHTNSSHISKADAADTVVGTNFTLSTSDGTQQAKITTSAYDHTAVHKFAFGNKVNNASFIIDGTVIGTDDTFNVSTEPLFLSFGQRQNSVTAADYGIWIRKFKFFPTRLTDNELKELTS